MMKRKYANKILSIALTLIMALSVVIMTPETADAASFSVSIDGQATKLGGSMYEKDGYHFAEVNAFSEAFGFPVRSIEEVTYDAADADRYNSSRFPQNEDAIVKRVSFFLSNSSKGYSGSYRAADFQPSEHGPAPDEWELTMHFNANVQGEFVKPFDANIWFGILENGEYSDGMQFISADMIGVMGEQFNTDDERIGNTPEKYEKYPIAEIKDDNIYIPLEIACWMLDYSINVNGSAIQISSANSALGIKPAVKAGTPSSALTATNTEVGILIRWTGEADATGYRIYRSETQSERGELIYEGGPSPTEYVDVNVKSNTAYYYTVCKLTAGQETDMALENNGSAITTGAILGEEKEGKKGFLLMTVDSPVMSVNGAPKEIDPGRGTAPKIVDGRTLMPISAAMEAMGGSVGWDDAERKVSLSNAENNLEMWIGQRTFTANGVSKELDIPPQVINGRTMLPIKFVAENIGCEIAWVGTTKEIIVVYWEK